MSWFLEPTGPSRVMAPKGKETKSVSSGVDTDTDAESGSESTLARRVRRDERRIRKDKKLDEKEKERKKKKKKRSVAESSTDEGGDELADAQAKLEQSKKDASKAASESQKSVNALQKDVKRLLSERDTQQEADVELDKANKRAEKRKQRDASPMQQGGKGTKSEPTAFKVPAKPAKVSKREKSPKGKGAGKSSTPAKIAPVAPRKGTGKASESTLAKLGSPEPEGTEDGAVETDSPTAPDKGVAKEAWITASKRSRERRSQDPVVRPLRTLESYRNTKGQVKLPLLVADDESDDEEWLDDATHPIDWYVQLIREIVGASANSGVPLDERQRMTFAWECFNPGQSCCFTSCVEGDGGPRVFSTDARYARHLVEYHRALRPRFGCLKTSGQQMCTMPGHPTNQFNTLRRGLLVRHLRCDPHRYECAKAVTKVMELKEGAVVGGKYYFRMEGNTHGNPKRLHILQSKWPAFHGRFPDWKPTRSASQTRRAKQSKTVPATAGSGAASATGSKRDHSASSTAGQSDSKKQKAVPKSAATERKSRSPTPKGPPRKGSIKGEATFSEVTSGARRSERYQPEERRSESPEAGTSQTAPRVMSTRYDGMAGPQQWPTSDSILFGDMSVAGMPELGFVRECAGLLESTGVGAVDSFGKGFREEANTFLFRLFTRAHAAVEDMASQVRTDVEEILESESRAQLILAQDHFDTILSEGAFQIEQLKETIDLRDKDEKEFYRVFGVRLSSWAKGPHHRVNPLIPRQAVPSRALMTNLMTPSAARGVPPRAVSVSPRSTLSALGAITVAVPSPSRLVTAVNSPGIDPLITGMQKMGAEDESPSTPGRELPGGSGTEEPMVQDSTVQVIAGVTKLVVPQMVDPNVRQTTPNRRARSPSSGSDTEEEEKVVHKLPVVSAPPSPAPVEVPAERDRNTPDSGAERDEEEGTDSLDSEEEDELLGDDQPAQDIQDAKYQEYEDEPDYDSENPSHEHSEQGS